MAFTKITNVELNSRGATTLPNQPTISASALKQEFDAPAKNIVAPKFNNLIDELEAVTSSASLGAVAPTGRTGTTVQGVLNSLSTDLGNVETSSHTHSNKTVIDKFADDGTGLTYDGSPISGAVDSVNGQTGVVVLDATDVGALPDDTVIPSNTSDLNNDSNFVVDASYVHTDNNYDATAKGIVDGATAAIAAKSTVTWNQQVLTGQKIATISINGTPTDVYAPTGGSPGTGAVNSVNGAQGDVVLNQGDINDVTITSIDDQHTLVYNANSSIWENEKLADVALTGSYNDLSNKPSIPAAQVNSDWNAVSGVAQILNKPTIPAAQIQSDWNQADSTAKDFIKNKPSVLGHNMLPVPDASVDEDDIVDAIKTGLIEGGTNDDVPSLNTIGTWSNINSITLLFQLDKDDTGAGVWTDTYQTDGDRTGWLWSADLYQVLKKEVTPGVMQTVSDIEIYPVHDGGENETLSLYAYRVDDDYSRTIDGVSVNGGCVAFKLNSPVKSTHINIGVKILLQRTLIKSLTQLT